MLKPTDSYSPIGIFDSGIGGLTIANAIKVALPNEELLYFGDTAHLPYGDKSADTIYEYSKRIVDFLVDRGCKAIVIACNSASAAAADRLEQDLQSTDIALINVIDPLINYVEQKSYKNVGVIATKATIQSQVFEKKIKDKKIDIQLRTLATPLLAPMIEEGFYNGEISQTIIDNYLSDEKFSDIEAILLACTHYPLIHKEIEAYFKYKVEVIDATSLVADATKLSLEKKGLLNHKRVQPNEFFISDYTESFDKTAKMFYGMDINLKTIHLNQSTFNL